MVDGGGWEERGHKQSEGGGSDEAGGKLKGGSNEKKTEKAGEDC